VVIDHGMGGSRAAAPVAKDVLTYLFDKPKAMEALFALEATWGGTINERMKREAEQWAAAESMRKQSDPQQASVSRTGGARQT
jgi:penicillin-binding protein 2